MLGENRRVYFEKSANYTGCSLKYTHRAQGLSHLYFVSLFKAFSAAVAFAPKIFMITHDAKRLSPHVW